MFKKILTTVLCLTMAFSLFGCAESSEDKSTDVTKSSDGVITTQYGKIKLGDYKKQIYVYTKDMKDTLASSYAQSESYVLSANQKTETLKKGTVKEDSTVNINYVGQIKYKGKKVKFEGGTAENQDVSIANNSSADGQTPYMEGFLSGMPGHKVGDTYTEKLKFPDSYNRSTEIDGEKVDLSGKDVWFTFTINSISKTTTPKKLTDKMIANSAATLGIPSDINTVKKFKEYVDNQNKKGYIFNYVMEKLMDTVEVVSYDKEEESNGYEDMKSSIESQYNVTFEQYLEACSMTEEEWRKSEDTKTSVNDNLKAKMIILAIASEENLELSEEEYQSEAESLAEGMSASVKELESQYKKSVVEYALVYSRVQDFFADNVQEKKGSEPTTAAETTAAETTAAETKAEETTK